MACAYIYLSSLIHKRINNNKSFTVKKVTMYVHTLVRPVFPLVYRDWVSVISFSFRVRFLQHILIQMTRHIRASQNIVRLYMYIVAYLSKRVVRQLFTYVNMIWNDNGWQDWEISLKKKNNKVSLLFVSFGLSYSLFGFVISGYKEKTNFFKEIQRPSFFLVAYYSRRHLCRLSKASKDISPCSKMSFPP